jgi:hypothetical protein
MKLQMKLKDGASWEETASDFYQFYDPANPGAGILNIPLDSVSLEPKEVRIEGLGVFAVADLPKETIRGVWQILVHSSNGFEGDGGKLAIEFICHEEKGYPQAMWLLELRGSGNRNRTPVST